MKSPFVTVFIPAYNVEKYVGQAIESIIAQTFQDFELLLIDDGSHDGTRGIAEAWAARDARVRVVSRANRGRPSTRNEAFDLARGRYLAVLDADDLSLPQRLQRQVAFMEAHPRVTLCGSRNIHIRGTADVQRRELSRSIMRKHPPDVRSIRAVQLFDCAVRQSTAMFRMETLRARGYRYNTAYPLAEDFELWSRMLQTDDVANLPDVLGYYRRHERQSTHAQFADVLLYMACAARATWKRYGVETGSISETAKLLRPEYFARPRDLPRVIASYRALTDAAERAGDTDVALLKNHMWMHLRRAFKRSLRHAPLAIPNPFPRSEARPEFGAVT
jgi:glycosyltransferase involved in cell wall biosynthesis